MRYESTPTVKSTGGRAPARGPRKGAVSLMRAILSMFDGLRSGGIYNPRPIRLAGGKNGSRWSMHADGRALNVMVDKTISGGDPRGHRLAEWLVKHHRELGIQYIVWAGRSWKVGRGWKKISRNQLPHFDHLHIEMIRSKADSLTDEIIGMITGAPYRAPSEMLRLGDESEWVNELRLAVGLPKGSEVFGAALDHQLRVMQTKLDLVPDGIAGTKTWTKLRENSGGAIEILYRDVVDRDPDQGGFGFWVARISKGESRLLDLHASLLTEAARKPAKAPSEAPTPSPAPAPVQTPMATPQTPQGAEQTAVDVLRAIAQLLKDFT